MGKRTHDGECEYTTPVKYYPYYHNCNKPARDGFYTCEEHAEHEEKVREQQIQAARDVRNRILGDASKRRSKKRKKDRGE